MDDNVNSEYDKINTHNTVVNMEWSDKKILMWESIRLSVFLLCFLCGHIDKFQINLCRWKYLCNVLTEIRLMQGRINIVDPVQTQMTSLWSNFNGCMQCISFKVLNPTPDVTKKLRHIHKNQLKGFMLYLMLLVEIQ